MNPDLLVRMRDIMAHRGPDGARCILLSAQDDVRPILIDSELDMIDVRFDLGLGHRRLSIIDLDTGDQPMSNEDGSIWLVYNGEIYNYQELREELRRRGHVFRSKSDTEVVIHAYEEYGEHCPDRFNGIFAFALWDSRRRVLFLARDHFGVKPLYYCQYNDRFLFASEIKSILCDPAVPRELDLDALNLCLTFRHTPSPWTLLKGIHKLSPGSSLTVHSDRIEKRQYRDDSVSVDRKLTEREWVERLRTGVEEAVVRQMVSDVPIGISLSSGVDSNTVLAIMAQHSPHSVNAFTVGFAGREDTSEIARAREAACRFGAVFYDQLISAADYTGFMERYIWHLEEPIGNESAAAYYFVAEMSRRRGVKVLLNGQGADEAFAGYGRYLGAAYGRWLRWAAIPPLRQIVPRLLGGTLLGERYHRFLHSMAAEGEVDRFTRVYTILDGAAKSQVLQPELLAEIDHDLPLQYIGEQLARAPEGTSLERMLHVDLRTSLPDNLLLCEDKMAMAASVEARVPFLDIDLVALAERIPGRFKLRLLRDKYIHRRACAHWIGDEITARPQVGFDNAVDLWLKSQLGDHLCQLATSRDSIFGSYLNGGYVLSLIEEHRSGRRDHQRVLFFLLSLNSWFKVFMECSGS